MILTIAIMAGIFFLLNTLKSWSETEVKGSPGVHATVLILSTWYLNPTLGVIFLCIAGALTFVTILICWKS